MSLNDRYRNLEKKIQFLFIKIVFHIKFSTFTQVEKWCKEAGGNITINYPQKEPKANATAIDDSNPYWVAINSAFEEFDNIKLIPTILMGATDARYIRRVREFFLFAKYI